MATPQSGHLPSGQPESTVSRLASGWSTRPYLVGTPPAKRPSTQTKRMVDPLPHETEDTQITGGTRSLVRRLTALNVAGTLRTPASRPVTRVQTPQTGSKLA